MSTQKKTKNILITPPPPPKKIGTSSCVFVVDKYMKVRIIEESKFHYIGLREKSREKKLSSMFTKKNSHQDCRTLNKKKKTPFVESPHPTPREKKKLSLTPLDVSLIFSKTRMLGLFRHRNVLTFNDCETKTRPPRNCLWCLRKKPHRHCRTLPRNFSCWLAHLNASLMFTKT